MSTAPDLSQMTEAELETLREQVSREQISRQCGQFLSGQRACDRGREPHNEHGYTMYDQHGEQVRVTWSRV